MYEKKLKLITLPLKKMQKAARFRKDMMWNLSNLKVPDFYSEKLSRVFSENMNILDSLLDTIPKRIPYHEYRKSIAGLKTVCCDITDRIEDHELTQENLDYFLGSIKNSSLEKEALDLRSAGSGKDEGRTRDEMFGKARELQNLNRFILMKKSKKHWSRNRRSILFWSSVGFGNLDTAEYDFPDFSICEGWIKIENQIVISFSTKHVMEADIQDILNRKLESISRKKDEVYVNIKPTRSTGLVEYWILPAKHAEAFGRTETLLWVSL